MEAPEIRVQKTPVTGNVKGGKMIAPDVRQLHPEVNPLEIDWSQVVRLCMNGDSGAWRSWSALIIAGFMGCAIALPEPGDAEDLTQDVFLKIYSNLASFDTTRAASRSGSRP